MGNRSFGRSSRRPKRKGDVPPAAFESCDGTPSDGESTPKPPEVTGSSEDRQTEAPESQAEEGNEVSDSVKSVVPAEVVAVEEKRSLQVVLSLYCYTTGERSIHGLDELPSSVHLLKEHIETRYSIPVCCQKILFDFTPLPDSQSLPLRYMRNGDVIEVQYKHKADVEEIRSILSHLNDMNACLESLQHIPSNVAHSHPKEFQKILSILRLHGMDRLVYRHFHCENEDHQEANMLFFLHNGGLAVLYRLHCLLLARPWGTLPQSFQHTENTLVTTFWDITDRCNQFGLRVELVPVVDNIAKSSLRGEVRGKTLQKVGGFFLDTIYKATGALCNLAELPQYRVTLASNEQLMLQFIYIMHSPAYNYHTCLVTLAGMVCLTYSRTTHQYLCKPEIIDGVLETCKMRREDSRDDALLLRYFVSLFFSILVTSSSTLIKETHLNQISVLIKEFLSEADHKDIHNKEENSGFYWLTLVPHMTVAYFPFNYRLPSKVEADTVIPFQMTELYLLCMELGVFSLQNVTTTEKHRKVLAKEGLVDYVRCLPWYLSTEGSVQHRACQLASKLKPLLTQPPSLTNISRARLASMHFGLEKVLSKQPCEIYMELYSSPT